MAALGKTENPDVLVGFDTSDDAGVYRLNDEQAIVNTADFITPPVDDPHLFGQVAAANALSDIYAMGARPLTCLSLVGFPSQKLGPDILQGIIAGAMTKISEAGAVLIGGHTTEDEEPKFGLAVTGLVHPDRIWRNSGAEPGDRLILTKPIGSGVLFNANRKKWVSQKALQSCLDAITILNRTAAEVMAAYKIHGATDVTGFGLAGHGLEMAKGAGVTFEINLSAVPVMDEALAVYERGMSTGMNRANHQLVENEIRFTGNFSAPQKELVVDPQTSGGLLVSVPQNQAEDLLSELHRRGISRARLIGEVKPKGEKHLLFR